jgi:hypothetical protein
MASSKKVTGPCSTGRVRTPADVSLRHCFQAGGSVAPELVEFACECVKPFDRSPYRSTGHVAHIDPDRWANSKRKPRPSW